MRERATHPVTPVTTSCDGVEVPTRKDSTRGNRRNLNEPAAPRLGRVSTVAAVSACAVLTALAVFQVALASGAPWGRYAWGGQHEGALPAPLRVGSAVSVLVYAAI